MALPASVSTQAVSAGDRAYMTAHSGTGQEDFVAGATTRAQEQFAQTPQPHENALAFQQRQRREVTGAADTTAVTAIRALLAAQAGSAKTGAQFVTLVTAINAAVVTAGRTTAGTFSSTGS